MSRKIVNEIIKQVKDLSWTRFENYGISDRPYFEATLDIRNQDCKIRLLNDNEGAAIIAFTQERIDTSWLKESDYVMFVNPFEVMFGGQASNRNMEEIIELYSDINNR